MMFGPSGAALAGSVPDMKSLFIALVVILELAGCHTDLNPGRCNSSSDCPTGQTCDLTQNGVCVCNTPACADGGAGTGGTGGGTTGLAGSGGTGGSAGIGADGGGQGLVRRVPWGVIPFGCARRRLLSATNGCLRPMQRVQHVSVNADCLHADEANLRYPEDERLPCLARADTPSAARQSTDPGDVHGAAGRALRATAAETIYVQNNATICSDTAGPIVATNGISGTGSTVTKPRSVRCSRWRPC